MKKLLLLLSVLIILICFASCGGSPGEKSDSAKLTPVERAANATNSVLNTNKTKLLNSASYTDEQNSKMLSSFQGLTNSYAGQSTTWNAVKTQLKNDYLTSERSKAVVSTYKDLWDDDLSKIQDLIDNYILSALQFFKGYDSDKLKIYYEDTLKQLLEDKIAVRKPGKYESYNGEYNKLVDEVDKANDYYSLIMSYQDDTSNSDFTKHTRTYTLLYPAYYKWEGDQKDQNNNNQYPATYTVNLYQPKTKAIEPQIRETKSKKYENLENEIEKLEDNLAGVLITNLLTLWHESKDVKTAADYQEIDPTFYNTITNNGTENTTEKIYSILEMFSPLYIKEIIYCLNSTIEYFSTLEKHTTGVLYTSGLLNSSTDTSAQMLTIDALFDIFDITTKTGTDNINFMKKICNDNIPYPYLNGVTISDAEKVYVAKIINLLYLIENPKKILDHMSILTINKSQQPYKNLYWLVDCLQVPMYYEETVYSFVNSKATYTAPSNLSSQLDKYSTYFSQKDFNNIIDYANTHIDAKYYKVESIIDAAINSLIIAAAKDGLTAVL